MDAPILERFPSQSFEAWHGIEDEPPAVRAPLSREVEIVPVMPPVDNRGEVC